MTAGAKTPLPARSDGPDNVDGSSDAGDIMLSALLGKLEMPRLRGLKADAALRCSYYRSPLFQRLVDRVARKGFRAACRELGLKGPHAQSPHLKNRGVVKSFVVLTAIVVLTLGNAIAAMPGAAGSVRTISAAEPIVTMADQELPFDRYWSKN
jgi:hypothetical protein